MKREIKFRAFNSEDKEIYSDEVAKSLLYKSSIGEPIPGKWVIEQFTGLKDRNGKEIYEGDIFQIANNNIYQIKYCEGAESNHEWYGGGFVLWFSGITFFYFDEYAMKNGQVIGNIHENPELL